MGKVSQAIAEHVDRIARAVAEHEAATAEVAKAEYRRDDAIRRALADGVTVADLVRASGLSRARIYQIRDRTR